jgi:mono/diheme cytochrome c family protein
MKKFAFIIIVLTSAAGLIAPGCALRRSEPIVGKTFTPKNMQIQHGEELYMRNCQKCHPGGEGGLGPALNPNPAPAFVKKLQVRVGLGVMPSFNHQEIAKEDLKDIAKYIKARRHF